jgi:pimeloyl-ACP methyl ester carboxylesterase
VIAAAGQRSEGIVRRAGARVHYQVFGDGARAILLLPTWSIVHSGFWRYQVPHLSERYTVIAFDGLGNGASDRPLDPACYDDRLFAEDAIAVLDAVGCEQAVPMSVSAGAAWGLILAAEHPERIPAAVFIAPSLPLSPPQPERATAFAAFDERLEENEGWLKFNRHYWNDDWLGFLEFFFGQCFTEADSEVEIAHFVQMGLETTPEVIAATVDAPSLDAEATRSLASRLNIPVLVVHGDEDAITPVERGRELAHLAGGELVERPGAGHEPQCRSPDETNAVLDGFLERHYPHGA